MYATTEGTTRHIERFPKNRAALYRPVGVASVALFGHEPYLRISP